MPNTFKEQISYFILLWVIGLRIRMFKVMLGAQGCLGTSISIATWRTITGYFSVYLLFMSSESLFGSNALINYLHNGFICYVAIEYATSVCLLYLIRAEMDESIYLNS